MPLPLLLPAPLTQLHHPPPPGRSLYKFEQPTQRLNECKKIHRKRGQEDVCHPPPSLPTLFRHQCREDRTLIGEKGKKLSVASAILLFGSLEPFSNFDPCCLQASELPFSIHFGRNNRETNFKSLTKIIFYLQTVTSESSDTSTAAATSTTTTTMPSNPKESGPRSVLQAPGSPVPSTTRSVRSSTLGQAALGTSSSTSPGWQSVGAVHFNKFQMKKSPGKKYLEAGESVICIHNKVRVAEQVKGLAAALEISPCQTTLIGEVSIAFKCKRNVRWQHLFHKKIVCLGGGIAQR